MNRPSLFRPSVMHPVTIRLLRPLHPDVREVLHYLWMDTFWWHEARQVYGAGKVRGKWCVCLFPRIDLLWDIDLGADGLPILILATSYMAKASHTHGNPF